MSDPAERVAVPCPACSPDVETVHEVLASGGGWGTLRCGECGHVHKAELPGEETVELPVVVSQDGESETATVEAPVEETLARGQEFVLETPEAILEVRITDLQLDAERRAEEATAGDVETIWTRVVDNVSVDVTINPRDGGDESRSRAVYVPGDYAFEVGETDSFGEERFDVTGLYLREDAAGYPTRRLDEDGDRAVAKDIQRVYATDRSSAAWSAW